MISSQMLITENQTTILPAGTAVQITTATGKLQTLYVKTRIVGTKKTFMAPDLKIQVYNPLCHVPAKYVANYQIKTR